MLAKLSILCVVTIVLSSEDLNYTKIAFTINGEPCITDCVEGKCMTGEANFIKWYPVTKSCKASTHNAIAPKYHTSVSSKYYEPFCLSNCGKFGENYEWCYISSDGSWDYCSSEIHVKWVRDIHMTDDRTICVSDCQWDDHESEYVCIRPNGMKRKCDRSKYHSYIQARNIYGEDCVGPCIQHDLEFKKNYRCRTKEGPAVMCAPPAEAPHLKEYTEYITPGVCGNGGKRSKKCTSTPNQVRDLAARLENPAYFTTIEIKNERNPVYSYTFQQPRLLYGPKLPIVVKAKITLDTLRVPYPRQLKDRMQNSIKKNLARMAKLPNDAPTNLIGYSLGGKDKFYNIIQLNRQVRANLTKLEETITQFLKNSTNSWVDMTIVVIYRNHTRPYSLGVDMVFYKDFLQVNCINDQIFSNTIDGKENDIKEPVIKDEPPFNREESTSSPLDKAFDSIVV